MPIYTRTGDRGKTSLFSGKRVWKHDARVATYGTIDELNSIIGIAIAHLPIKKGSNKLKKILLAIQSDLFYIGAYLADLPDTIEDIDLAKKTQDFEKNIDYMMKRLPPAFNFVLPGGGRTAAFLHQARTVARRAERDLVRLSKKEKGLPAGRQVDERVMKYINRLSDLLYASARFANMIEKKKEIIWSR
jgi:cob(I)alamin adenosyltransferase